MRHAYERTLRGVILAATMWRILPIVLVCLPAVRADAAESTLRCSGTPRSRIRLGLEETKACIRGLVWIDNAIVQGPDVIAAIAAGAGGAVRIRNSEIEGGLYFDRLPQKRLASLSELQGRDELRFYESTESVFVVPVAIQLPQSIIRAGQDTDEDDYAPVALSAPRAIFMREFDLRGVTIEGSARFPRASFLAGATFSGVNFQRRVTFDSASFSAPMRKARGAADNGEAGSVRSSALFERASFQGTTMFTYTRFDRDAVFREARFERVPIFDKTRICGDAHFGAAVFNGALRFVDARVAGDAHFESTEFPRGADFASTQFGGTLRLVPIGGTGELVFARTRVKTLNIGASDSRSRIDGAIDFSDARMSRATLTAVRTSGPVNFARSHIGLDDLASDMSDDRSDVRMFRAAARSGCPMASTSPRRANANAGDATPQATRTPCDTAADASIAAASPVAIDLCDVDFYDRVTFERAILGGRARFRDVTFRSDANMSAITFQQPARGPMVLPLAGIRFDNVDFDWTSVAPFAALESAPGETPASALMERLEKRYVEQGRLADALSARRAKHWASVREAATCVRTGVTTREDGENADCARSEALVRVLLFPFWGLASGFGTSLVRLLVTIVIVNVAFAAIYFRFGTVFKQLTTGAADSIAVRLHPLAAPSTLAYDANRHESWVRAMDFRSSLGLSTVALLRLGDRNVAVDGAIRRVPMRTVLTWEWAIGIPLLIDLVYTLSETQPFLQRLVSGTIG